LAIAQANIGCPRAVGMKHLHPNLDHNGAILMQMLHFYVGVTFYRNAPS